MALVWNTRLLLIIIFFFLFVIGVGTTYAAIAEWALARPSSLIFFVSSFANWKYQVKPDRAQPDPSNGLEMFLFFCFHKRILYRILSNVESRCWWYVLAAAKVTVPLVQLIVPSLCLSTKGHKSFANFSLILVRRKRTFLWNTTSFNWPSLDILQTSLPCLCITWTWTCFA